MDAPKKPVKRWTVAECRRYLQARAVPCSGATREQLIDLVKKNKKTLPPLEYEDTEPLEDDHSGEVSEDRRTVVIDGRSVVYPNPFSVKHWEADLDNRPDVDSGRVLIYLLSKRGWTADNAAAFHDTGDQLCRDFRIDNVRWKRMDAEMVYVKAECVGRTSPSQPRYCVWLLTRSRGTVESSGCQCPGQVFAHYSLAILG